MRRPLAVLFAVLALAGTACRSGNAGPDVTPAPPSSVSSSPSTVARSVPTSSSTAPAPSSTTSTTAASPTTTPTTAPANTVVTAVVLPEGIGTKVDSAPGVSTPGDIRLLLPKVWAFVPSVPAPNDNHVQPPAPEDLPIISAYLEAQAAEAAFLTQRPLPTVASQSVIDVRTPAGVKSFEALLQLHAAAGDYYDLADGVVVRPVVIASPRSGVEAFIFDCELDSSGWRKADGTLAAGAVGGVTKYPAIARMVNVDGRWVTDALTTDERVCA